MRSAFLAAAWLLFAFPAHAQMTCDQINRLVGLAPDGFRDVRGEEVGDNLYLGTIEPAGTEECTAVIDYDERYRCVSSFSSKTALATAFEAQSVIVQECLAGWTVRREPSSADRDVNLYWRLIDGDRIDVSILRATPARDPNWIRLVVEVTKEGK